MQGKASQTDCESRLPIYTAQALQGSLPDRHFASDEQRVEVRGKLCEFFIFPFSF
jgi:hypothetical protein